MGNWDGVLTSRVARDMMTVCKNLYVCRCMYTP